MDFALIQIVISIPVIFFSVSHYNSRNPAIKCSFFFQLINLGSQIINFYVCLHKQSIFFCNVTLKRLILILPKHKNNNLRYSQDTSQYRQGNNRGLPFSLRMLFLST